MQNATVDILGTNVTNVTMRDALDLIVTTVERGGGAINFLNAHCANVATRDEAYRRTLESSTFVFGDGSGVKLASRLMGSPLVDNVNGTDLAPLLFERMSQEGLSLYMVGGRPGVARAAAQRVSEGFPKLRVVGSAHGYRSEDEWDEFVDYLADIRPDVVFVALGVPGQEVWIDRYRHRLPGTVCMGVGGLLDFLSRRMPRAPRLLRRLGLEWTYRLYQEPGRMWRRYLVGNVTFTLRALWYAARRARGTVSETTIVS